MVRADKNCAKQNEPDTATLLISKQGQCIIPSVTKLSPETHSSTQVRGAAGAAAGGAPPPGRGGPWPGLGPSSCKAGKAKQERLSSNHQQAYKNVCHEGQQIWQISYSTSIFIQKINQIQRRRIWILIQHQCEGDDNQTSLTSKTGKNLRINRVIK